MTLSLDYMRRIGKVLDVPAIDLLSLDDQDEFVGRDEMQLVRAHRAAGPMQSEIIMRVAAPLLRVVEATHTQKNGLAD